jgi:DNA-binding IclR family transcriptional regulator
MPAAERAMAVLTTLAAADEPVSVAGIARAIGAPRSSTYQLLGLMAEHGFVMRVAGRWTLGPASFAVGARFAHTDGLERRARPILRALIRRVQELAPVVAHLAVLHGRETLYVVKESPPLALTVVTDIGVRLPANLTASGRSMLMQLAPAQVRALFPDRACFVDRTGQGPATPAALRKALAADRRRGYAVEDDAITVGLSSVAAPIIDHLNHPAAAIGLTFRSDVREANRRHLAAAAMHTAAQLATGA